MKKKIGLIIGLLLSYINVYATAMSEFEDFFNSKVSQPLKIIAVVLFLVLTGVDYAKAIFDKDASPKKANNRLLKRVIALIIIFFSGEIVQFITILLG